MHLKKIFNFYQNLVSKASGWVNAALVLFALSALAGFFVFYQDKTLIHAIAQYFKDLVGNRPGNSWDLAWIIFQQNLFASLLALVGGVFFGLTALCIVTINGFLLGYVIHFLFVSLAGNVSMKTLFIAVTIIPHGIFELSIVLTAAALGFRWGIGWLTPAARGKRWEVWKENAQASVLFLPLVVFVLALAALVEVFVSGKLAAVLFK